MAAMTGPGADGTGARQGSSHLTASTDLDATPNQLPLAAVLDASLQRRKAAAVSSVALDGAMRDFTLVSGARGNAGGACRGGGAGRGDRAGAASGSRWTSAAVLPPVAQCASCSCVVWCYCY